MLWRIFLECLSYYHSVLNIYAKNKIESDIWIYINHQLKQTYAYLIFMGGTFSKNKKIWKVNKAALVDLGSILFKKTWGSAALFHEGGINEWVLSFFSSMTCHQ